MNMIKSSFNGESGIIDQSKGNEFDNTDDIQYVFGIR